MTISEPVQLALIGFASATCTGILAIMLARVKNAVDTGNRKSDIAIIERNRKLDKLQETAEETKHTTRETKKVANGEKMNLLESNYSIAKRLADITNSHEDIAYANFAKRLLEKHRKIHNR